MPLRLVCARATLIAFSTASEPLFWKAKRLMPSGMISSSWSMSAACMRTWAPFKPRALGASRAAAARQALQPTIGLEAGKMFCCAKIMLAAWSWMALTTAGWLWPVLVTPMPARPPLAGARGSRVGGLPAARTAGHVQEPAPVCGVHVGALAVLGHRVLQRAQGGCLREVRLPAGVRRPLQGPTVKWATAGLRCSFSRARASPLARLVRPLTYSATRAGSAASRARPRRMLGPCRGAAGSSADSEPYFRSWQTTDLSPLRGC